MRIDWDVAVAMDDGVEPLADVFRPHDGRAPAIVSYGPYAKGLPTQVGYPEQWRRMCADHPDNGISYFAINQWHRVLDRARVRAADARRGLRARRGGGGDSHLLVPVIQ